MTLENRAFQVHRHFYASSTRFEQSLDVYVPEDHESPLVVILVVGSGWLGHHPCIYKGTSWWNSSGPKTIASLGYTCICIRHRSSFPTFRNMGLFVAAVAAILVWQLWRSSLVVPLVTIGSLLVFWLFCVCAKRGVASFDDMLSDVADALVWIRQHSNELALDQKRIVFGGYSSGAHVASTLLGETSLWQQRGLEPPEQWMDAILYLSGVLAVRRPSEDSTASREWFTNWILRVVFSKEAPNIPSPLVDSSKPRLPHLLVGCQKEVFGLKILDIFFCSQLYAQDCLSQNIPARYIALPRVDHWTILASQQLKTTLAKQLSHFAQGCDILDEKCRNGENQSTKPCSENKSSQLSLDEPLLRSES